MTVDSQAFKISVIDGFVLRDPQGRVLDIPSRKARQLILFLALARGMQAPRETICGALWPESESSTTRNTLRVLLSSLKKHLKSDFEKFLVVNTEVIGLRGADVDLLALENLAKSTDAELELEEFGQPGLRGLAVEFTDSAIQFADWVASAQRRYTDTMVRLLERLCTLKNGEQRLEAARTLLDIDPLREQSHRLLMEILAEEGENALALRQFDICQDKLRRAYGVGVSEKTRTLRDRIINRLERKHVSQSSKIIEPESGDGISIVVTPLRHDEPEGRDRLLATGITSEITSALTRFKGLVVIASNSAFAAQTFSPSALDIGRSLRVRYVTEGSVERKRSLVRISIGLVEVATSREIWRENYSGNLDELGDLEVDIANTVASHLEVKLASAVAKEGRRLQKRNYATYEVVLRARELLGQFRVADAKRLLQLALGADPDNAQAHAWLSLCHWWEFQGNAEPEKIADAVRHGEAAVENDAEDAIGHAYLSLACLFARDFARADYHCLVAMQLNPNDPQVMSSRADYLYRVGAATEAIALLEKQLRFNPIPPEYFWESKSIAHWVASQYDESLACIDRLTRLQWWDHCYRAHCLYCLSRVTEAEAEIEKALALKSNASISVLLRTEPFQDATLRQMFAESLRHCGLPD